jgi:PAS domain S-box-containing protein
MPSCGRHAPEGTPPVVPNAVSLESLGEAAPAAMVGVDQGGVSQSVHPRSTLLFGYGPDALVGAAIETLLAQSWRRAHRGHRGRYVADPQTRATGADAELSGRRRDGTEFGLDVSPSLAQTQDRRTGGRGRA